MSEYVLKCEPAETKPELKEVLKFIDNPLFTNSIIDSEFMKYINMLFFLILTIFLGYKTFNYFSDWLIGKEHHSWPLIFIILTIGSLIVTMLSFIGVI